MRWLPQLLRCKHPQLTLDMLCESQAVRTACNRVCVGQGTLPPELPAPSWSQKLTTLSTRRHQVADDSFGFVLPAAEDLSPDSRAAANLPTTQEEILQPPLSPLPAPEPADLVLPDAPSVARAEPNTSTKRREPNGTSATSAQSSSSPNQPSSGSRSSARIRDAATSNTTTTQIAGEPILRTATTNTTTRGSNPLNSSATKALSQLSLLGHSAEETPGATLALAALTVQDKFAIADGGDDDGMVIDLPLPARPVDTRIPNGTISQTHILRSSPNADVVEDVVGESPLDAPGSGRRQRVRQQLDQAASQSVRLQRAVMEAEERRGGPATAAAGGFEPATSSPLARKTRKSSNGAGRVLRQEPILRTGRKTTTTATTKTAAQITSSPGDGDIVDPLSSDPVPAGGTPGGPAHSSSPSTRSQTRRTAAAGSVRGASSRNMLRGENSPGNDETDGGASRSSPTLDVATNKTRTQTHTQNSATTTRLGPKGRRRAPVVPDSPEQATAAGTRAPQDEHELEDAVDDVAAEHIPATEAASRLINQRKRMRVGSAAPSPDRLSPELNSEPPDSARPAKRQRSIQQQKGQKASPAKQAQPKHSRTKQRPAAAQPPRKKPQTTRRRRSSGGAGGEQGDEDEAAAGNDVIPIVVQRYTRPTAALRRRQRQGADAAGSDEDEDVLLQGAEIPYADRTGVNAVDVLTQMCEEVIDATLGKLQRAGEEAPSQAVRKEYRVKLRALEAFQEELRTRLLEHVRSPLSPFPF